MTIKVRSSMPAQLYNEWRLSHNISAKQFAHIVAVDFLESLGTSAPNRTLAVLLDITPVGAGQNSKKLAESGIIIDSSPHPLYRDWSLTPDGHRLLEDIKAHSVISGLEWT